MPPQRACRGGDPVEFPPRIFLRRRSAPRCCCAVCAPMTVPGNGTVARRDETGRADLPGRCMRGWLRARHERRRPTSSPIVILAPDAASPPATYRMVCRAASRGFADSIGAKRRTAQWPCPAAFFQGSRGAECVRIRVGFHEWGLRKALPQTAIERSESKRPWRGIWPSAPRRIGMATRGRGNCGVWQRSRGGRSAMPGAPSLRWRVRGRGQAGGFCAASADPGKTGKRD